MTHQTLASVVCGKPSIASSSRYLENDRVGARAGGGPARVQGPIPRQEGFSSAQCSALLTHLMGWLKPHAAAHNRVRIVPWPRTDQLSTEQEGFPSFGSLLILKWGQAALLPLPPSTLLPSTPRPGWLFGSVKI